MPQQRPSSTLIMFFLDEICGTFGISLVATIGYHLLPRRKSFTLFLSMHLAVLLNVIEKLLMRSPRPYFLVSMTPLNCKDHEYGMPSGHAQITTSFYLTAAGLLFTEDSPLPLLLKPFVKPLAALLCTIVSLNRFFMGVHSLD